ncbi:hypothetical protein LR48_Vigan07g183900 [Vigna angularis]|uniref:Uncharacterized protein n=1 Tax=Phaseolus angularis TaxID=3914 RepID=A0A0L9UZ47_PHAAN|nr:hypothetical protein LR48_Vigan07g183900 [Vigna angularis]
MPHIRDPDLNKWTTKKAIYIDYLRYPGRYKMNKLYLHNGLNREEKIYAFVLSWLLLPGRYIHDRLITKDVFLLNAIKTRIPTNWVVILKDHMIKAGVDNRHNLPYGVFISKVLAHQQVDLNGEVKIECNRSNEIGKAILSCIGMKKIVDGWFFRDVQTLIMKVRSEHESAPTPGDASNEDNHIRRTQCWVDVVGGK